ncbi:unnamed protein product [Boreogadus saida]
MAPNEASDDGKEVGEGHSTGLRSSGCQGTHTDDAGRSARGAKEFESSKEERSVHSCHQPPPWTSWKGLGWGSEQHPLLRHQDKVAMVPLSR